MDSTFDNCRVSILWTGRWFIGLYFSRSRKVGGWLCSCFRVECRTGIYWIWKVYGCVILVCVWAWYMNMRELQRRGMNLCNSLLGSIMICRQPRTQVVYQLTTRYLNFFLAFSFTLCSPYDVLFILTHVRDYANTSLRRISRVKASSGRVVQNIMRICVIMILHLQL